MSNTKRIMEQAQSFASAWSLVGGAFDGGDGKERAEEEKAELQRMVEGALAGRYNHLALDTAGLVWTWGGEIGSGRGDDLPSGAPRAIALRRKP